MNKFLNCLYILEHKTAFVYNKIDSYKIGSSKCFPQRIRNYKTYYPIAINVICYFFIKNYCCYQLDDDIKKDFNINRINDSGGTEFYQNITYQDIINYLTSRNIEFEIFFDDDYKKLIYLNNKILKNNFIEETTYLLNKQYNYDLINDSINLRDWQKELIINFREFILNENKSSIVIAPTGCGKSFMIRFLIIFCYIPQTNNDVIIMNKRKEIFDQQFILDAQKWIDDYDLNIEIYDMINNKYDFNDFDNQSNKNRIYIINNDKFISSKRYNDYQNYSFGKIKLAVLDESQWAGADEFNQFLSFIKSNIVDKIIGFSATPVRIAEENKLKTLDIFKNEENQFNILYSRDYLKSIEEKERVPNKWIPIFIDSEEDKLNKTGIIQILNYLNNFIIKSVYKKGILWFKSSNELDHFNSVLKDEISKYENLSEITFFHSYSKDESTKDNIKNFKEKEESSILLVVMRATEGFDDPKIDFAFNLYLTNSENPLLDQQKEGRVCRICKDKNIGYYGFLVNRESNYEEILIKRLGNWIKYIEELFKTQTGNKIESKKLKELRELKIENYINQFIDEDLIREIDLKELKEKIIAYNDNINILSSINDIKKYMQKINRMRNIDEIIDTKDKYWKYARENNLPCDINIESYLYNWVKFLRSDFEEFILNYYTKNELKELNIKNEDDYIERTNYDNKLPEYKYILNGIYNIDSHFNLKTIFKIKSKKKY